MGLILGDAPQGEERAFEKLTWNRYILLHCKHLFGKTEPSPAAHEWCSMMRGLCLQWPGEPEGGHFLGIHSSYGSRLKVRSSAGRSDTGI